MKNGKPNLIRDIIEVVIAAAVWVILLSAFFFMIRTCAAETAHQARTDSAEASVTREEVIITAKRYATGRHVEEESKPVIEVYTEGEGPAPEWYRPDEPMAAEWVAPEPHPPVGIDPGGIDWNICTTVWGWDGHGAEVWELDLLARVFYLEFWGTSLPCSEAGCDAILNLWDTGRYGRTLFDALSYYDPDYGYTYRVYPKVWQTDYNPEGLAWCREFCEERFVNGPEWEAQYFQLGGYHDPDWVTPAYEIDGVYFSMGR